jgi:hypothetical protein
MLTATVGPAFFAVATLAPLYGHWRSLWEHDPVGTPPSQRHEAYSLYAAGNAGSFATLIAYPLVIEPVAGLTLQADIAAVLYLGVAALMLLCGWQTLRHVRQSVDTNQPAPPAARRPSITKVAWTVWLRWALLAAIPASWLASVTTHATVEVAPIPLLWIVPLGIYLASFVVVFSPGGRLLRPFEPLALLVSMAFVTWMLAANIDAPTWGILGAHMMIFFVVCTTLHGMLVDERPPPEHLTSLYLAMAVGGAAGGLWNALVAPALFDAHHEFPLAIAAAAALMPQMRPPSCGRRRWIAAGVAVLVLGGAVTLAPWLNIPRAVWLALLAATVVVIFGGLRGWERGLAVAALLLATFWIGEESRNVIHRVRTFFGVLRVCDSPIGPSRKLVHGSISHGVQLVSEDPGRRRIPLSYYGEAGPLGSIFRSLELQQSPRRVGIAGLGVGTVAAYARPTQEFVFFEIDPEVVRIANNPRWFSYLTDCLGETRVVVDDARMALQREPDASLDLLVIDAFTGDSVPTHLLTREALALYGRKLSPAGVVAFHISNKYLDFAPVIEALAAEGGWMALNGYDEDVPAEYARVPSHWMALSRSLAMIQVIYVNPTSDRWVWKPAAENPRSRPWTDDQTPVAEALRN